MARPQKEGMDYFPHDNDAANDEKIEALRVLYGNDGYAFYFILLERIYRTAEYELDISDAETIQILSRKVGVTEELFNKMLETALKRKCFDLDAYEQRGVLTSSGIKKRASVVLEKRETMRSRYKKVSDAETTQETKAETPQSKVKESKVKKTKGENIKPEIVKQLFGEKVLLSEAEYGKLIVQHGEQETKQMISILDNWYMTKGKPPNKSDYHCMIGAGWVLKRFKEDQLKQRNKDPGDKPSRPSKPGKYENFYL